MINQKRKSADILFFISLFVLACLLYRRCRYGFANNDESFYLTIPYRLLRGDSLLDCEWHLSQLSGVLLIPLMKVFLAVNGSTEGINLFFRYSCVTAQLISAVVIYLCLRRFSPWGAVAAVLTYAAFVPFGISALSYNSMGMMCLASGTVLYISSSGKGVSVISGILYAAAVLCCPYLALLIAVYAAAFIINRTVKHKFLCPELADGRKLLFLLLGIVISAAVFLAYLLPTTDLGKAIASLPGILGDSEHSESIISKIPVFFQAIIYWCSDGVIYVLFALLFAAGIFARSLKLRRLIAVSAILLSALLAVLFWRRDMYINFFVFPVNMAGLICAVTMRKDMHRKLIQGLWLPGIIYAFCIHLTSNQSFYVISAASVTASLGSIIIVSDTVMDIIADADVKVISKLAVSSVLAFALLFPAGCLLYCRLFYDFSDSVVYDLTVPIDCGAEKGIYVSPERYEQYNAYLSDVELISPDAEGVAFISERTWLYLCAERDICTYSAWLSGVNDSTIDRLQFYYRINPDKLPDAVYIDAGNTEYASVFSDLYGYNVTETTPIGSLILYSK